MWADFPLHFFAYKKQLEEYCGWSSPARAANLELCSVHYHCSFSHGFLTCPTQAYAHNCCIIPSEQPNPYINSDVLIYTPNALFTSLLDHASIGASPAELQIKSIRLFQFLLSQRRRWLWQVWHSTHFKSNLKSSLYKYYLFKQKGCVIHSCLYCKCKIGYYSIHCYSMVLSFSTHQYWGFIAKLWLLTFWLYPHYATQSLRTINSVPHLAKS